MKPIVLCLDVLVAIVRSHNDVCPPAIDQRIERVRFLLYSANNLRLCHPPTRTADARNPIMRVIPIGLIDTRDLTIHILLSSITQIVVLHATNTAPIQGTLIQSLIA
jgi:hypothetical protein